jgi:hypothetical protein
MEKTKYLSTSDICRMFGVSQPSVVKWRGHKKYPLPSIVIPGTKQNSIRFNYVEVVEWAEKTGRKIISE